MFDLLIKNGSVVDGSGAQPFVADVAVKDGKIAAVQPNIVAEAAETLDAAGLVVTPGFVDVHTHYDAQVTWDDRVLPSSAHGVTTIVIGTCGIGFAPVRPGSEDWLISLTEGVEDIPGSVLSEGIRWSWETFPEYLDTLDRRHFAVDIGAHVPHSAVRAYVMGRRTETDSAASDDELRLMASITRKAVQAGALGLATSRLTTQHFCSDGSPLPGTDANENELMALAEAVRDGGGGVIQIAPFLGGEGKGISTMGADGSRSRSLQDEIAMMRRIVARSGQPITFTLAESFGAEDVFAAAFETMREVSAKREPLKAQFTAKPIGAIATLDGYHAFQAKPSYLAIAHLPLEERVRRMRDPKLKAALMSEVDVAPEKRLLMNSFPAMLRGNLETVYPYDDAFDYEPGPEQSMAARAKALNRDPIDYLYDYMLEDGGRSLLVAIATNYSAGDLRVTEAMLREDMLPGLADGGAHVRAISDASQATYLLTHWARDRKRGPTLPLETLVKKLAHDTASFYGLHDRGMIAPGLRADINVIDPGRLGMSKPYLVADLPGGSRRFHQDSRGYVRTIVAGVVTRRDDKDTGERPGRLVRGRRAG